MSPKRVKHNKYRQTIERELDLHGLTLAEAEIELNNFIASCRKEGLSRVRVIPGKGIHSPQGYGVLNDFVRKYLKAKGYSYTQAKMKEGGEGAYEFKLV